MKTTAPLSRCLAFWMLAALLGGCASTPPEGRTPIVAREAAEPAPPQRRATRSDIALLIGGEPVTWETLRPLLAEAGGGVVVEDLALEHALRRALRARNLTITEGEIEAARETWLALLSESGVGPEAESSIRERRGLGEHRFRRLLWRNAALRALIDPSEIEVTDTEVGLARRVRAGERYLTSGVIARDAATALAIARAARAHEGGALAGLWIEAGARDLRPFQSVISPLDPAFPDSIRRALPVLERGAPSDAIAVEQGFAVVIVDAVLPPASRTPDDATLRRELTIRKTRLAMERLARTLLDRTEVTRLDPSLR